MYRRTLLLIASVLVAAVGVGLVAVYVRGADARARQAAELVEVVVASRDIAAGTPASAAASSTTLRSLPSNTIPEGAFTSTDQVVTALEGQTAQEKIWQGTVLVKRMFDEGGASPTQGLQDGWVDTSIELEEPDLVPGRLAPGSRVAVIHQRGNTAVVLLENIEVRAVGSASSDSSVVGTTGSSRTAPVPTTIVRLRMKINDNLKLRIAEQIGNLTLSEQKQDDPAIKRFTGSER